MAIDDLISSVKNNFNKSHKDSPGGEIILAVDERPADGLIVDDPLFEYILDRRFLAYGRCYLVYGKKGSSKTTLALDIMKRFQKAGGWPIWIETEQAADLDYAAKQGLDLNRMVLDNKNQTLEEVLDKASLYIKNLTKAFPDGDTPVCIVLDSLAGICPEYELEENHSVGDSQPGRHAKLSTAFYRKIVPWLANEKAIFIMINQLKDKIGGMGGFGQEAPEALIGGEAQRFMSTYQLKMDRTKDLTKADAHGADRKIGSMHQITAKRNKLGREGTSQRIQVPLYIEGGMNWGEGLVKFLAETYTDLVSTAGAGYFMWEPKGMKTIIDGVEQDIDTEKKYRPQDLATIINGSVEAKELIREAFGIPPLPDKAEWDEVDKERKKRRGKESGRKAAEAYEPTEKPTKGKKL